MESGVFFVWGRETVMSRHTSTGVPAASALASVQTPCMYGTIAVPAQMIYSSSRKAWMILP